MCYIRSMKFIVALAVLAVVVVLAAGVTSMMKGGEFNAKHSNKLMQLRVATQAVAVVIIMAAIWMSGQGPG